MRKIIAIAILLSCYAVYGQRSTNEEPVSFRTDVPNLTENTKNTKVLPLFDMEKIKREDKEDVENGMPPRFGYKHQVNYDLNNSGEWATLQDGGRLWRLILSCLGALSINLLYDRFWLPEGAKFFIYSNDRKHRIGALTSANSKGTKEEAQKFATGLVYGDQVTLEYYLPRDVDEIGIISIAHVIHGYRYIALPENASGSKTSPGTSLNCNININCPQGQNWQKEKKRCSTAVN